MFFIFIYQCLKRKHFLEDFTPKFGNFQVMLDTVGPEIQVCNKGAKPIELKADDHVTITSDVDIEPSTEMLAVNYDRLAEVGISNESLYICLKVR